MDEQHGLIAIAAARAAGKIILPYFGTEILSEPKADGSPLTMADRASHQAICDALESTGIPVVSEEGDELYLNKDRYWIVDPLDGTKEFLAANDEFTINIALIESHRPVFGVVYAPAIDELYVGKNYDGSWVEKNGVRSKCEVCPKRDHLHMAVSRFHDHVDSDIFALNNLVASRVAVGSALKYGRIALGDVDVYPRLVGTSEWDTAAGQAILESAGGSIIDLRSGQPLTYGKPNRRNGRFIAFRSPYQYSDFQIQNI